MCEKNLRERSWFGRLKSFIFFANSSFRRLQFITMHRIWRRLWTSPCETADSLIIDDEGRNIRGITIKSFRSNQFHFNVQKNENDVRNFRNNSNNNNQRHTKNFNCDSHLQQQQQPNLLFVSFSSILTLKWRWTYFFER